MSQRQGNETQPNRLGTGSALLARKDADDLAVPLGTELHLAIGKCEEGVITADSDVLSRVDPRSALANDDRSSVHDATVEHLHTEALAL